MVRIPQMWQHLFSADREPRIEVRLYQLVCLMGTFLSLGIITPVNLLQQLSWILNGSVIAFGLICFLLYQLSRRGHHLLKTFALVVGLVLNVSWFANAGSNGAIAMFFFLATAIITLFFRGWQRWLYLGLFLCNGAALFTLDYLHPTWTIPYQGATDRYWDLLTGFLMSAIACVMMLWLLVSSYDEEQKKLSAMNQELQKNLDEIQRLQGMLPICSWCKKVRDDEGLWTQVERYLEERTELSFTHGMCPDCARTHYPGWREGKSDSGGNEVQGADPQDAQPS